MTQSSAPEAMEEILRVIGTANFQTPRDRLWVEDQVRLLATELEKAREVRDAAYELKIEQRKRAEKAEAERDEAAECFRLEHEKHLASEAELEKARASIEAALDENLATRVLKKRIEDLKAELEKAREVRDAAYELKIEQRKRAEKAQRALTKIKRGWPGDTGHKSPFQWAQAVALEGLSSDS